MESVLIALGLAGLAAVGLAFWRWARALSEVLRALESLGEGQRVRPILSEVWGPAGRLIRVFNAAAPEVQGRIDRLREDRQFLLHRSQNKGGGFQTYPPHVQQVS